MKHTTQTMTHCYLESFKKAEFRTYIFSLFSYILFKKMKIWNKPS